MTLGSAARLYLAAAAIGMIIASPVAARDAAFMEPAMGAGGADDEAVKAEPKNDIDIGETNVNMARRVTLFFANMSGMPVQVEKVNANADANVLAEIANDDCSKQGVIAPQSKCTVEISITPTSPGTWTVELLLTHNGAGRIARAKISGKTSGTIAAGDRKETGLDMSSKEVTPISFGDLEVNGKAVRSALMVNDSPDPITILAIDVIEATNGLSLLEQGCSVDLELKPGETCPVTLLWAPTEDGQVSTDLIIRHSGRQGFTVIPIRGKTKGLGLEATTTGEKNKAETTTVKSTGGAPNADAVLKAASLPQIPADALAPKSATSTAPAAPAADAANAIRLIGTVGNKALLLLPDNTTKIVITGDDVDVGNDQKIKVLNVTSKSVELLVDGKKKELKLGSAPALITKASTAASASKSDKSKSGSGSSSSSSALSSTSSSSSSSASSSGSANPNVKQ